MDSGAIGPMRVVFIMKPSFIVFGLLLIYLVIRVPVPSQAPANPVVELAITVLAFTNVIIGFFAQRLCGRSMKRTSRGQSGPTPVNQWMRTNVVSLACFNACMLFGFILHSMGGRVRFVQALLTIGIISLLIWRPQPPPSIEEGKPFQD